MNVLRADPPEARPLPVDDDPASAPAVDLSGPFQALAEDRHRLTAALEALGAGIPGYLGARAATEARRARQAAVDVTLVGQIKAGKTALMNALIRRPGLLPVDVNPWTAVVTAVHARAGAGEDRSEFRFFDRRGWETMLGEGGRAAEIARRFGDDLGRDDEATALRAQVEAMRARTRARLGRNVDRLLGGRHRFDGVDPTVIARYVCLGNAEGEDDLTDTAGRLRSQPLDRTGRYAELVEAADLHLEGGFGVPVVLRDTPGVNDPFLLRERVTLKALADSRICVVVLNARQALGRADVALLRVLFGLDRRHVVLFVNRIDELVDPLVETREIEAHLRRTLAEVGLADDLPVVFGSALWAEAVLLDALDILPDRARRSLERACAGDDPSLDLAWHHAGIAALAGALARSAREGDFGHRLAAQARRGLDLVAQARLFEGNGAPGAVAPGLEPLDFDGLQARLVPLLTQCQRDLMAMLYAGWSDLRRDLRRAAAEVSEREGERLRAASGRGARGGWQVDAITLRARLLGVHEAFAQQHRERLQSLLERAARDLEGLYRAVLAGERAPAVHAPPVPPVPPPTSLGRPLALDATPARWQRLFERLGGPEARVARLRRLLEQETEALIAALGEEDLKRLSDQALATLDTFLHDHGETLRALARLDRVEARRRHLDADDTPDPEALAQAEAALAGLVGE